MKIQEEAKPHRGIQTELMFNRVQGEVARCGQYTVVRTPATPDYYFGNLLVLEDAPRNQDRAQLEADFADLVGAPPLIKHRTFLWPVHDDARATPDAFIDAGYEFSQTAVLIAHAQDLIAPAQRPAEIVLRRYRDAADWSAWQALKLADNAGRYPEPEFLRYLSGLQAMYQQMIADHQGDWWGAFIGDTQVANLGMFFTEDSGRFQAVFTAPAYRNRGICHALVHHVAEHSFGRATRLVMVADESHHAARLYETLGFQRRERMASLCWWPA
ncbi:GNAT family N-acetyltransferase [Collimonas pratensis]|uniref:GNAT family N-acetyltransferase n=1 Tax=Collimonas pratensis TaxID=279113 RepID=UPI00143CCA43|nr:GNAT family N-acetyltransferase [Collimonas pratensis]NKI70027.1 GNAT family N-acetyltransferase [Collimonas pratensis]